MKVVFSVIQKAGLEARLDACVELAAQHFNPQGELHICAPKAWLDLLDQKLWQTSRESFLPHRFSTDTFPAPIVLTEALPAEAACLIYLHEDPLPASFSGEQAYEIVTQDEPIKTSCRNHFKQYRQYGWTVS
ncbi:MAG: DNA polymerase III subunit chi [Gammaproteobacteria bacterium]|nr:DNA polymerase III subunit chi [Gammaproteobacteria bacterium]